MSHAGRVFLGEMAESKHGTLRLPSAPGHHVARVMRARVGDTLSVFDANGLAASGTIAAIVRDAVDVEIDAYGWHPGVGADASEVTWLQGVPKGDKLETIVRQATELGVAAIRPVFTARSIPRAGGATARLDRLRSAAIAACEQCGRSVLPVLHPATTLDEALREIDAGISLRIVPWEAGGEPLLSVIRAAPAGPCAVLVGPEGGLDAGEVERAVAHGFVPVSLGSRILRTETVAAALLGVLSAMRGDLSARPDARSG